MKKALKRFEIKITGNCGQGIPIIADILAEVAFDLKYRVVENSFCEREVRGGLDSYEVILCDCEIDYPKVMDIDILAALSQEGYDAALEDTSKKTVQILDSLHVAKIGRTSELSLHPLTNLSHARTGSEEYANFVALGLIIKKMKLIKERMIINHIKEKLPSDQREKALKAFKEGLKLN